MKIGILTQPLHLNYGGVLQAWSLQHVLKQLGHSPEIIARSYNIPPLTFKRLAWQITVSCWSIYDRFIKNNKRTKVYNPFKRKYGRWFSGYCDYKFIKNYIPRTKELYSDKEFNEWISSHPYDAFIVGSDQTWREEYSPNIETYFLNFIEPGNKCRKLSYAASFGTTKEYISKEKIEKCKELLSRFDAVSVREDGGLNIVHDIFERKDAIKVLDPTLLLDASIYKSITLPQFFSKEKYVATYILDENDEKREIINSFLSESSYIVKRIPTDCEVEKLLTISKWIASIANSQFVITDSFHGCVFAIIFRKPFIVIGNSYRGIDRFSSLLDSLHLSDRMICGIDEFRAKKPHLVQNIDYEAVIPLLNKQRELSLTFLKDVLT